MAFEARNLWVKLPCDESGSLIEPQPGAQPFLCPWITVVHCNQFISACGVQSCQNTLCGPSCQNTFCQCTNTCGCSFTCLGSCGPDSSCLTVTVRPGMVLRANDLPVLRAELEARLRDVEAGLRDVEAAEQALEERQRGDESTSGGGASGS
jgi:hypothetical protein